MTAERDLPGLNAQNDLLMETMLEFGFSDQKIERVVMKGFGHGEYLNQSMEDENYPINKIFGEFITKNYKEICKHCD